MARKDVDLVIRAKDEASRAVDSITKAFSALVGSTDDIQKSGAQTSSALGTLGKALNELDRTFRGMTATGKLSSELDKARSAMDRLQAEAAGTKANLDGLTQAQQKAGAAAAAIQSKVDGATAAVKRQDAAVQKAVTVAKKYETALKETERELAKLETKQRNLPGQIDRASAAVDKARERYTRLGAAVAAAEKPSATLVSRFNASEVAVNNAAAKLDRLKLALTDTKTAIDTTNGALTQQKTSLASSSAEVEKQATVLGKIKANAAELGTALKAAGTAEAKIANDAARATDALNRQDSALNKAQVEFDQFAIAAGKAGEAISRFVGGARGTLEQALRQQGAALAESKRELAGNEQAVRDYAAALATTNAPSAKLVQDLAKARAASRTMRAEIDQQETALRDMSRVLKATADDYDAIIAAQARFQAIKGAAGAQIAGIRGAGGIAADLEEAKVAASLAAAELQRAKAEAAELGSTFSRIGPPTQAQAVAMNNAAGATRRAKDEMNATGQAAAQLSTIYNRARTGLITFAQAERQAASVSTQLSAALSRIRAESAQVAATSQRLAAGMRSTGSAAGGAVPPVKSLAQAFRELFGAQRQSLSIMGRVQAQLVALTASYVGLYGVASGIGKTVDAFKTLEAATSRLNVVFDGDQSQVGKELDFIRRTADRLKISFDTLSDNYTQFAVAAKGTNLEGANTRKVFTSISEAARVFKLDNEQVKGVFTALTQIVSKGTVQMEELRQQLGDRLPGALQVMAAGLGYAQDEMGQFFADITAGKISSDALVSFADELNKRVGDQLPAALQQASAEFSNFGNVVYKAFLRLAQGGFIDAAAALVRNFNEQLESPAAQSFIDRVSQGLALLADVLSVLVSNFRLVAAAIAGLIGAKLGAWAVAAYGAFGQLNGRLREARVAMAATAGAANASQTSLQAFQRSTIAARAGVSGLTIALRTLGSATLIGAAFTVASIAISAFVTSSTDANEVLGRSNDILDKVKNAWEAAGGSIDRFRASLDGLTLSQVQASLQETREILQGIKDDTNSWIDSLASLQARRSAYNIFTGTDDAQAQYDAIENLNESYAAGITPIEDYKVALDGFAKVAATDEIRAWTIELQANADKALEVAGTVEELEGVVDSMTGTTEEATGALQDLTGASDDAGASLEEKAAKGAQEFQDKLAAIKEFIPGLKAELEGLAEAAELSAAVGALGMGPYTRETQGLIDQATGAQAISGPFEKTADAILKASDGIEATAILLRKVEGFRPTPYWDVNANRVGFGSDTITLADGTIKKVTSGMRVSVLDANRDLVRRIGEFQNTVRGQIGSDRFGAMQPAQQAALTSIAYNYGSLPDRLVKAIRTGNDETIGRAIQALGGDNKGVNRNRRNQEAGLFLQGGSASAVNGNVEDQLADQTKEAEKAAEAEARRAGKLEEYNEGLAQRLELQEVEAANEGRLTLEATVQKAIEEERAKAKKAGRDLTQEEIERITAATTAEYQRAAGIRAQKTEKEALEAAEQRVTDLQTQQNELQAQRKIYAEQGDTAKVAETDVALQAVNAQLVAAIANAQSMWGAIGGAGADAAIAKLQTANLQVQQQAQATQGLGVSWQQVGDLFANGLTNAFDNFAKAVAEGKDVGEAARDAFLQFASDFLRQIAQMIIKQAILNALSSFGLGGAGGGAGGGIGGVVGGLFHSGGTVSGGRRNRTRLVDPAVFANAPRFHSGGLPGIKTGEVPAILEEGEEVLTKSDPRNILNGGKAGGGKGGAAAAAANLKVVNTFDAGSFISEGLGSVEGEQSFMNFVRANSGAIKGALG